MGGVLDRIDSALLAIPVMYYLLLGFTYLSAGFRTAGFR
jgi:CDP-diglyceride synthetase